MPRAASKNNKGQVRYARPKIKKGDLVVVIAGKDRYNPNRQAGEQEKDKRRSRGMGRVLRVDTVKGRVVVEGVNIIKRHTRPNPPQQPGGVVEREAPIHISNVMLWSEKEKSRTRVKIQRDEHGTRMRVTKKCGTVLG